MKTLKLLIALFLFTNFAHAQFGFFTQKNAKQIKASTLIVTIEEENEKTLRKLEKKPESLQNYKDNIAGRNHALRNAVEKYWSFTKNVVYKNESEIRPLMKAEKDKYVVIRFGTYLEYDHFPSSVGQNGQPAGWSNSSSGMTYNPATKYSALSNEITTLEIGDPGTMINCFLPNLTPSESDAVYGVMQMQFILKYLTASDDNSMLKFVKQVKTHGPKLKRKTLLLDKDDLDKSITEKELKQFYPYPVKVVSQEEIDKAILSRDTAYAFVEIVSTPGSGGSGCNHYVSSAEDGSIYCVDNPGIGVKVWGVNVVHYNERIKKGNLETYSEAIKKK